MKTPTKTPQVVVTLAVVTVDRRCEWQLLVKTGDFARVTRIRGLRPDETAEAKKRATVLLARKGIRWTTLPNGAFRYTYAATAKAAS